MRINQISFLNRHLLIVYLFFLFLYFIFFSPALLSDKLLAPGDGIIQSVPAYYSTRTLWTNSLLSGYPVAADVTSQTWYPISFILGLIPHSWNFFVINSYVLASSFTYGYIFTITKSKLASLCGGIVYGMSGFMMAHLGHTSMIHTASWMPLVIWSSEQLRHPDRKFWIFIGSLAICCSFLAGHPQISTYTMGLSLSYSLFLGLTAPVGRWKYYKVYFVTLVLGIGLAAIQILPTAELSNLTPRSQMSFAEFNAYSLPLREAFFKLMFPYLAGDGAALTEVVGYVGILPLIFAAIYFQKPIEKLRHISYFWLIVAIITFLLSTGTTTPLSWLTYNIPIYKKFRILTRHYVEMALAVSVLSSMGIAIMQKQSFTEMKRFLNKVIIFCFCFLFLNVIALFLFSKFHDFKLFLFYKKFYNLPIDWFVPFSVFCLSILSLIGWKSRISYSIKKVILPVVLIIDLSSFGWFYSWPYDSPKSSVLNQQNSTKKYEYALKNSYQRVLPVRGANNLSANNSANNITPNLSRLGGIPSASGYGPLILSRYSKLLSMTPNGDVTGAWYSQLNRSLDILSIRYVLAPQQSIIEDSQGVAWFQNDENIILGSGCGKQPTEQTLDFSEITHATTLGIVSSLGCSTGLIDNSDILKIAVTDNQGNTSTQTLKVGRDTSEYSYDCSEVKALVRHRKANVFKATPNPLRTDCKNNQYVTFLPLQLQNSLKKINFKWNSSLGAIHIQKLTFIDNMKGQYYPISTLNNSARWKHLENIGNNGIYENQNVMPRVWLVPEVITEKPEVILTSIQSSTFPNGNKYDPKKQAFVEEKLNLKIETFDTSAKATIQELKDTKLVVNTKSSSASFLVISDIYYPGWQAKIDDKPATIYRTNYVLRGVPLSPGEHTVEFKFIPLSIHLGLGISIASLTMLGYILIFIKSI